MIINASKLNLKALILWYPNALNNKIHPEDNISAIITGFNPFKNLATYLFSIKWFKIDEINTMIKKGAIITPSVATTAPKNPFWDAPTNVAKLTAIGPGVDSQTPIKS